jgi:hypothetical protein
MRAVPGWNAAAAVRMCGEWARRRGVIAVLSDFYDDEDETLREMAALSHRGHDVLMLQLLSPGELSLARALGERGQVELEALEGGTRRTVDVTAVDAGYRARVQEFLARCRARAEAAGIDYQLVVTSTAPADALRELLRRRAR